jgi:hypothetical protein
VVEMDKCEVCGMEVPKEKIKHVHIKGKEKSVCSGCIAAIKGLA